LENFFPPKSGDVVSMNYPFYIGRNHIFSGQNLGERKTLEVGSASERESEREKRTKIDTNGQR
jgi:hypothetical protein